MKRIFIALDIHAGTSFRKLVSELRTELDGEKIRWVDISNMHLTLAFLGEMRDHDIDRVSEIMEETSREYESFELVFTKPGIFRDINQPRVLWMGLKAPEILFKMREDLCSRLRNEGLYSDEKRFSPHITLGRMKFINDRENLHKVINSNTTHDIPVEKVDEIILYQSILKPDGPQYISICKALLKSPCP